MQIYAAPSFNKAAKKLHTKAKKELDKAVRYISDNPSAGEQKKGELAGIRVYKFSLINQRVLLAYRWEASTEILTLLALGPTKIFTET